MYGLSSFRITVPVTRMVFPRPVVVSRAVDSSLLLEVLDPRLGNRDAEVLFVLKVLLGIQKGCLPSFGVLGMFDLENDFDLLVDMHPGLFRLDMDGSVIREDN
jgi:hypothetical protein